MKRRLRIDLDGVSLHDADDPSMVVAIFRYRTTDGVVLLVPESVDVTIPWDSVEEVVLDLANGELRVRLTAELAASQNWLRGARTLVGRWLDRFVLRAPVEGSAAAVTE